MDRQRNRSCWRVQKICEAEGIEVHYSMSQTKAAFAERTKRSLRNLLYRYNEDYGYKYIHDLSQFVRILKFRKTCSIDLISKKIRNFDFLSILYSKPLEKFGKPKFENGDRVFISKYDLPFSKRYKLQFTHKVFQIFAISSKKLPTDAIKDGRDEIIRCNFYQKELIKAI